MSDILDKLIELSKDISPAPFEAVINEDYAWVKTKDQWGEVFVHSPLGICPQDARFFVAFRNAFPELVEQVKAQENELNRLRGALPKTADGVTVIVGMKVYAKIRGEIIEMEVAHWGERRGVCSAYVNKTNYNFVPSEVYSSRDAVPDK